MRFGLLLSVLLLLATRLWAGEAKHSFTHPAMGTMFRIEVCAAEESQAAAAVAAAFARVDALEQCCSDYLPESELMRLCRAGSMVVSEDLAQVLSRSLALARLTEGAFDFTAGHMTNQWRRARRKGALPSVADRAKAKALTGFALVSLDEKTRLATLAKPGMQLDLGGIAKGFAADAALMVLRAKGFPRAVVAASGDLAIGDAPLDEPEGWDIAVRTFEKEEARDELRHLRLQRCGISTSGDLHQSVTLAGQRYSHIIDPATGLGLTQRIACSVIAPDATTCDALATAMCVLGEAKGTVVAGKVPGVRVSFARGE